MDVYQHQDNVGDVLYIEVVDPPEILQEPTYCESINDIIYIEVGSFSKTLKGMRVMSPDKNRMHVKLAYMMLCIIDEWERIKVDIKIEMIEDRLRKLIALANAKPVTRWRTTAYWSLWWAMVVLLTYVGYCVGMMSCGM